MLYISNALYLAEASAGNIIDKPLIGWESIIAYDGFSSAQGDNASVLWSPATYDASTWESDPITVSEGPVEIIIDMENPSALSADYLGIVGHNFYENDTGEPFTFVLQYSFDQIDYEDAFDELVSPNNAAIMVHFDSVIAPYWRLVVRSSVTEDVIVRIAHIRLGPVLRLQRKMYVGMSPFTHARRVEKIVNVSDNGKYLGSRATSTVNLYSINQLDNTPSFVRENITPFLKHAELIDEVDRVGPSGTFFSAWRPESYPDEVLYCHPPQQVQYPNNHRPNGAMQWSISGEAEA